MKNIRYLMMENMEAGAIVSGLGIRYLYTDRPLITLNHKDDMVKISARGNKPLISRGLDLSVAMRKAAEAVGGVGGGHTIASGASIPPGTEERFLAMMDEIVGEQLHGTQKARLRPRAPPVHPGQSDDMIRARLVFWGEKAGRWLNPLSRTTCPICVFRPTQTACAWNSRRKRSAPALHGGRSINEHQNSRRCTILAEER